MARSCGARSTARLITLNEYARRAREVSGRGNTSCMVPAVVADVREMPAPNARGGRTWAVTLGGKRATPDWNPVFPQGTWPASSLPVQLYIAAPKSRDLGDDEDAEVEVAARAWNRVPCTAFRAEVAGVTQDLPADDTTSGVYFEDTAWPSDFTP